MSKKCMHAEGAYINSAGEHMVYCQLTGEWRNVDLGECYKNCDEQYGGTREDDDS